MAELDADAREAFEERAAVMEFDGGAPRIEAERAALVQTRAWLAERRAAGHRFELGRVAATPAALRLLAEKKVEASTLVLRHATGDWGHLPAHDRRCNEEAVASGARILSAFVVDDATVWIVTEADRSSTSVFLPSEY